MKEIKLLNTNYKDFDFEKMGEYEVIEDGSDDVYVIQNYPQRYLYHIEKDFDAKKLQYMGYKIVRGDHTQEVVVVERIFETFHVVKPCETLDSIAHKYNTTVQNIMSQNVVKSKVFIGQILKIN